MKATGIVRRIDDLGRVIIPKEIRRSMRIREGDPLEIYTSKDGEIIFKKYSPMGDLSDIAAQVCESLNNTTGHIAVITDRDACISVAGTLERNLINKPVSELLDEAMDSRKVYQYQPGDSPMTISDDATKFFVSCAAPILAKGEVMGCVLFATVDVKELQVSDTDYKLLQTISGFFGKYLET